jgi:hypothetical protein
MTVRTHARAALVAGLAAAFVAAPAPAHAIHQDCRNEASILLGGDDFFLDIGPGLLFVGFDKGDQSFGSPTTTGEAFVCVASDVLGIDLSAGVSRALPPRVEFGAGCALDVPGGGCELPSFQVVFGTEGSDAGVVREGLPAGNGSTFVTLPGGRLCVVAVGQACA